MSLMLNSNSDEETLYADSVFSTYLYTGNGSTQTITNGIDLAGKGGMVWCKTRSYVTQHAIFDTVRGANAYLGSNQVDASNSSYSTLLTAFNSNGFSLGNDSDASLVNYNGRTYASWTFRKAAKFFDVVTYTGTGSARTIAHSLGVAPGMIIVKRTDTTGNWQVYHRSLTSAANSIQLNLTDAQASAPTVWNSTAPTSSVFSVGTDATVNASGGTYVAYLYAHDTSSTGIIQCGSYTGNSDGVSNPISVNLGWEPQYVLIKNTGNGAVDWHLIDSMRGFTAGTPSNDAVLNPNSSSGEGIFSFLAPSATGFIVNSNAATVNEIGVKMIYMAIRRPNKPPTSGTQVYKGVAYTGTGTSQTDLSGVGFSPDAWLNMNRTSGVQAFPLVDRLRGTSNSGSPRIFTNYTAAEELEINGAGAFTMNGASFIQGVTNNQYNGASTPYIASFFKRAPGFFDVVCYTGTGVANYVKHNLGVPTELIIVKNRSVTSDWFVAAQTYRGFLNSTASMSNDGWNHNAIDLGGFGNAVTTNATGNNYVCYAFATLAGISKVGSYTGNGSSQNIECGFAAGARFVLIKATSTTGDWLVADTARGIVSGNDPRLSLNSTAAEVTGEDWLDPYAPGFTVNQTTASANASGVSYIFLAIS